MTLTTDRPVSSEALQTLLEGYTVEVTGRDHKGVDHAGQALPAGSEVFVANLPKDGPERLIECCVRVASHGLKPVPHLPARNIRSAEAFDRTLGRLAHEAGVERALVIGGDRDHPEGPFDCSLQLLQTGAFQRHGVRRVYFAGHPEGHPRVADAVIFGAIKDKLRFAADAGLQASIVTQFAFEAGPYLRLAERLRQEGVSAPLRLGVAGPADRVTLMKYALMCGVGASIRALKEKQDMAKSMLSGETPEMLLREVAAAQAAQPDLGVEGVHFFTFGALPKSVEFAQSRLRS